MAVILGLGLGLGLGLAACGGDEESVGTPEEDQARAERAVLNSGDLPGLTMDTDEADDDDDDEADPFGEAFGECVDDNELLDPDAAENPRGAESSFSNDDGSRTVLSGVSFAESETEAEAAFDVLTSPGFASCFEGVFRTGMEEAAGSQLDVDASVSELPTGSLGDEAVGYRVTVGASGTGGSRTGTLDFVYIRVGRGLASLSAFTVGPPFADADRTRLAELLGDRLQDA